MIYKDERYIQLCELGNDNEIRFTKEFIEVTKSFLGMRQLASQLISHWGPEYIRMLDYFGPDDSETDKYTGIDNDTDPIDVREDIPDVWSYRDLAASDLEAEWYRDIMRAKLVSLRFPERLIKTYIKAKE